MKIEVKPYYLDDKTDDYFTFYFRITRKYFGRIFVKDYYACEVKLCENNCVAPRIGHIEVCKEKGRGNWRSAKQTIKLRKEQSQKDLIVSVHMYHRFGFADPKHDVVIQDPRF